MAVDVFGNVYLAGNARGDLGGPNAGFIDAFLMKLDADGNQIWATQIGTTEGDLCSAVATDGAGNVYMAGDTSGDLAGPNAGLPDAFLAKFDATGGELWTKQVGTGSPEVGYDVAVDASGNAYMTGITSGHLGGPPAGSLDIFLGKFDAGGGELWITRIGTTELDAGWCVAADGVGNVYLPGYTDGSLGGPSAGDYDAVLLKYEIPEPTTLGVLGLGGLALLKRRP